LQAVSVTPLRFTVLSLRSLVRSPRLLRGGSVASATVSSFSGVIRSLRSGPRERNGPSFSVWAVRRDQGRHLREGARQLAVAEKQAKKAAKREAKRDRVNTARRAEKKQKQAEEGR
jgi:hypothetical protein